MQVIVQDGISHNFERFFTPHLMDHIDQQPFGGFGF
jgi:hypothetical protein